MITIVFLCGVWRACQADIREKPACPASCLPIRISFLSSSLNQMYLLYSSVRRPDPACPFSILYLAYCVVTSMTHQVEILLNNPQTGAVTSLSLYNCSDISFDSSWNCMRFPPGSILNRVPWLVVGFHWTSCRDPHGEGVTSSSGTMATHFKADSSFGMFPGSLDL